MASAWIRQRWTKGGSARWRVEYRLGGAGTKKRYAGSFPTKREALIRKAWVSGELAARRVPDLSAFAEPTPPTIVADAARRWLASRIDVAESTKTRNELEVERIDRLVGSVAVDALTPEQVATFVTDLVTEGYARGTIRKTLQTLAMILDRERINPNPVRDKQVKLPREDEEEINPPTAQHAEAVYWLLPSKHRLAFLFLDWSGARVSAIDHVIVSDYDEPRRRVRLRKSVTKTKRALDRPAARTSRGHRGVARAARGSRPRRSAVRREPFDLAPNVDHAGLQGSGRPALQATRPRHRRISLLHAEGKTWARIGEFVGSRSLSVTAEVYTHVLSDETELDYATLLAR
jgi:hypothetical protein